MQWLQNLNQSTVDNLNYVRCEATRHFRNKKKECLKAKIDELESNSKMKNIRDLHRSISDFKIHSLAPLVPEPSAFGVAMLTEKSKRHKSPGID